MAFKHDMDDDIMAEINMTPLVDVMLVLLIIFIVTIPVINHAVELELPQASSTPQQLPPERITLSLDATGKVFWNQEAINPETLELRLAESARATPQPELHLRADKATAYEHVAATLASANRHGLGKIAFVMEPGRP